MFIIIKRKKNTQKKKEKKTKASAENVVRMPGTPPGSQNTFGKKKNSFSHKLMTLVVVFRQYLFQICFPRRIPKKYYSPNLSENKRTVFDAELIQAPFLIYHANLALLALFCTSWMM